MPISSSILVRFFLLSLAGLGGFSAAADSVTLSTQEQQIAGYLTTSPGQQRPEMILDPILTEVARAQASDMAANNYFGDTNPQGYGPDALVMQKGYVLPASYGTSQTANEIESIGAGYSTASGVWQGWMNSSPHKTHLLALEPFFAAQTHYGVGYAYNPNSEYQYYWVVITAPPPIVNLAITTPDGDETVTTPDAAIAGTTGSVTPAASVQYRVENSSGIGQFVTANGTLAWSGTASNLAPGLNTIRVRSYASDDSVIAEETVVINYYLPSPLTVAVSGSGSVTAGFSGTSTRAVGISYTVKASPAAGWLFAGWTGGITSSAAEVTFTMEEGLSIQALFIPNPYLVAHGVYNGLLTGSGTAATLLTVDLSTSGGFTGKFSFDGKSYSLRGAFDPEGAAILTVSRGKDETPLSVDLNLDLGSPDDALTGTISDGTNSESFSTAQQVSGATGLAGSYTAAISPPSDEAGAPQGNGVATITVGPEGSVRIVGSLADGTTFSQSSVLTRDSTLPLFASLYSSKGSLSGILNFRSLDASDIDGAVTWIKPARPQDHAYPAGFSVSTAMTGSRYARQSVPAAHDSLVTSATPAGVTSASVELGSGNWQSPVDQSFKIVTGHDIPILPDSQKVTLNVNSSTGLFEGRFADPVSGQTISYRGVLLQKQNAGYGWFMDSGTGGNASVDLNY